MTKSEILEKIDIGSRVAEDEQKKLKQYFIKTHAFKELDNDNVDIIYGFKGTGKSAIYLHLLENRPNYKARNIHIVQAENIRGDSAFKSVIDEPPTDEMTFRSIWKLYFLVLIYNSIYKEYYFNKNIRLIGKLLRQSNLLSRNKSLVEYFTDTYSYIKKSKIQSVETALNVDPASGMVNGFSGKIVLDNAESDSLHPGNYNISTLFSLLNTELSNRGMNVWVALDRLDTVFEENDTLEENAIRGLFKAYLDLGMYQNIRLKIFLRTDIWNKITSKGFREASHITRFTIIKWTEETALNLVIKRFIENIQISEYYNVEKDEVLHDYGKQNDLFYRIFPDRIEKGSNKSETLRWIISHTYDGTNTITPREIIHLLLELRRLQLNNYSIGKDQTEGQQLFERSIFKEALVDVSRVRMEQTIFAEYNSLKPFIQKLSNRKATSSPDKLAEYFGTNRTKALSIADALVEIGVLRKIRYQEKPYYEVPFVYRSYLNSVQGRSDSDNTDEDRF